MELSKIKIGKKVSYKARTKTGTGKVSNIVEGARGSFVEIEDKNHPKGRVAVRASQVSPA